MNLFNNKLGIDLGTVNCVVTNNKKEILLNEPTIAAIEEGTEDVIAVGNKAYDMLGKTPQNIKAVKPLFKGVIANYTVTKQMLEIFINKSMGRIRIIKPDIAISIPAGSTSVEYRAVLDAVNEAGGKNTYLVPEPLAAAVGAGLPVFSPTGNLIVNLGGGTTEVAVVSLGGIVSYKSIRTGGTALDESIMKYVRKEHGLLIGPRTAEKVKFKIGTALKVDDPQSSDVARKNKTVEVRGRDFASGMPRTIKIDSNEIAEAIEKPLGEIINGIQKVLEKTPPELSSDILDKGCVLSGGTSLLNNLDDYITKQTDIPAIRAEDPLYCVVNGIGEILDNLEYYERSLIR